LPPSTTQCKQDTGTTCRFPNRHDAPPPGVMVCERMSGTSCLRERLWRSGCERKETFASGKLTRLRRLEDDDHHGPRRCRPLRDRRRNRDADTGWATRLGAGAVSCLLVAAAVLVVRRRCGAVDRTRVRLRAGHGQPEHQREYDPDVSHRRNYTALSFQRPRRNSTALATASVENAMVTAQATP